MKMNGLKRFAAVLLATLVAMSAVPASVMAADDTASNGGSATEEVTPGVTNPDGSEGSGSVKTGLQEIDGAKYYFDADGVMVKDKLITIDGSKYYFGNDGKMVSDTVVKIGKTFYLFGKTGERCKTVGIKTAGDSKYYVVNNTGKVSTKGWQAVNYKTKGKVQKRAYYCRPSNGKIAVAGTRIGHLTIPGRGYFGEAYYYGIKTLDKKGWTLKSAFNYSKKLKYTGRSYRTSDVEKYSLKGFKTGKGNCYVMAATFCVQAKLLGYDVTQVYGKVDLPHSWTEIKHNGKTYVYDPNFTNETGRNGYKIYYGKKGTWRYIKMGIVKHAF